MRLLKSNRSRIQLVGSYHSLRASAYTTSLTTRRTPRAHYGHSTPYLRGYLKRPVLISKGSESAQWSFLDTQFPWYVSFLVQSMSSFPDRVFLLVPQPLFTCHPPSCLRSFSSFLLFAINRPSLTLLPSFACIQRFPCVYSLVVPQQPKNKQRVPHKMGLSEQLRIKWKIMIRSDYESETWQEKVKLIITSTSLSLAVIRDMMIILVQTKMAYLQPRNGYLMRHDWELVMCLPQGDDTFCNTYWIYTICSIIPVSTPPTALQSSPCPVQRYTFSSTHSPGINSCIGSYRYLLSLWPHCATRVVLAPLRFNIRTYLHPVAEAQKKGIEEAGGTVSIFQCVFTSEAQ